MSRIPVLFLIIASSLLLSEEISRKGAKAQRKSSDSSFAPLRLCVSNNPPQTHDLSVEVFHVLELPLTVHEALLVKSDKAYLLKLSLSNSSDLQMIGLRYSLVTIDSENKLRFRVNRTEGFSISPYTRKSLTFKTPIKFKSNGERLVLMLEQVVSRESIWEVIKAKDAFEAYARGDFR